MYKLMTFYRETGKYKSSSGACSRDEIIFDLFACSGAV